MSDMSSMSRETKKQQLKQRVIRSSDISHPPRPVRGPSIEPEDEDEEVLQEKLKARRKKKRILLLAGVVIVCILGFLGYVYLDHYEFTEYKIRWEQPMTESGFAQYTAFGNNVLKYSKDGAAYINEKGEEVWVSSYEMKTPVAAVSGDYAVIADQKGNNIYIFDTRGNVGQAVTQLPILKATVSSLGLVAAILDDGTSNIITYYRKDGTDMNIDIRTALAGDGGYPIDLSLSPNSHLLMVSYVYLNSGVMKNKVVFYNFSNVGQNVVDRLVGGFNDEYASKLAPRVKFLTDMYACVFSNDSLDFYSLRDEMSPKMIKQQLQEEEIKSIFYCSGYAGCITYNSEGEQKYVMNVYHNNGEKVFSTKFNYEYTDVDIDDTRVILYNENSCQIYNLNGNLKFSAEFDFTVSQIQSGKRTNSLIVTGPQVMKEMILK